MGWKTDPVYGLSDIYSFFYLQLFFPLFTRREYGNRQFESYGRQGNQQTLIHSHKPETYVLCTYR